MSVKIERINSELQKQITKVIAEDIKDPRMGDAIVGVTKVYTTPDLKYAKVYLSVYASQPSEAQEAYFTVCRSKNFIRNKIKDAVNVRLLPELNFVLDDSVDYSIHIDGIIQKIHQQEGDRT